jgi:putative GTP pyrophosphokinase
VTEPQADSTSWGSLVRAQYRPFDTSEVCGNPHPSICDGCKRCAESGSGSPLGSPRNLANRRQRRAARQSAWPWRPTATAIQYRTRTDIECRLVPRIPTASISNSRADGAAELVRTFAEELEALQPGEQRTMDQATLDALRDLGVFRAMHAYPMTKATMGVRAMIQTELKGRASSPSQRHKRMARIIDKLLRPGLSTMRLSQMEDIGGCRAVVETVDDLRAVERRISRQWSRRHELHTVTDYIADPKDDGYRAVHIITRRDGRLIEVQLRTDRQQGWANAVEDAEALTGYNIKDGEGPADLRRYFNLAAERLAREDLGDGPDSALERDFARVREQIRHYYRP